MKPKELVPSQTRYLLSWVCKRKKTLVDIFRHSKDRKIKNKAVEEIVLINSILEVMKTWDK